MAAFRIAVLISGTGTNLQALLDTVHRAPIAEKPQPARREAPAVDPGRSPPEAPAASPGRSPHEAPAAARDRSGHAAGGAPGTIEIAGVASSRPNAPGLDRARRARVEAAVFAIADHPDRTARDLALGHWLEARGVELVVLAGFMELLGPDFIRRFAGRIVNVHPSLLPAFPGANAIEQAIEHGAKVTGVTVHFVDERVDSGPILLQEALDLSYPARIGEIEERVHEIEHRLLPRAVRLIAAGRARLDPANPRVVLVDDVD